MDSTKNGGQYQNGLVNINRLPFTNINRDNDNDKTDTFLS